MSWQSPQCLSSATKVECLIKCNIKISHKLQCIKPLTSATINCKSNTNVTFSLCAKTEQSKSLPQPFDPRAKGSAHLQQRPPTHQLSAKGSTSHHLTVAV